jgi:hypothetical protein
MGITDLLEIFLKSETWLAASMAYNLFATWRGNKFNKTVSKTNLFGAGGSNQHLQLPTAHATHATQETNHNNKPVITTVMETRIQQSEQTAQSLLDILEGQMEQTKFLQGQLIALQKELQIQRETNLKNNKDMGITHDNNIQA